MNETDRLRAAAIAEALNLLEELTWVDMARPDPELPDDEVTVLACDVNNPDSGEPFKAYHWEGCWWEAWVDESYRAAFHGAIAVTHWRHLPSLPNAHGR